jgi:hypothetical protein
LAGFEHMVVEVTLAGDPHPAAHHRQFAGPMIDAQRRTIVQTSNPATICIELRIHHQSPEASPVGMASTCLYDRLDSGINPMNSVGHFDADLI